MRKWVLTLVLLSVASVTFASSTNAPFERGALTELQKTAWRSYVLNEAAIFGCEYGDDIRLSDSFEQLIDALQRGDDIDPVNITYRTLLSMGPNTRELISRNIQIASIECNAVYYSGEEIIGLPVIPFEEALTILHDDYANYADPDRIEALATTFAVASMDPRWFWAFFLADRAHLDLLGFDYDIMLQIESILSTSQKPLNIRDSSFSLLYHIHSHLNNYGLQFYSETNACEQTNHEPSLDLIIWPEITDRAIKNFYNAKNIRFKGKWKPAPKREDGGITISQEKPVVNPAIPYFNVTRGLTIYSTECKE